MSEVKINPLELAIRYGFQGRTEIGQHIYNGMHAPWEAIKNMAYDRAVIADENDELRKKYFSMKDSITSLESYNRELLAVIAAKDEALIKIHNGAETRLHAQMIAGEALAIKQGDIR